jgi:hypothetical protein
LPTILVTVAINLATLFIAALIIGHMISLFVVTRRRARDHHLPLTVPTLVDCCLFTPAVAADIITVAVAVTSATTIVVNATAIDTAAAATVAAATITAAVAVIAEAVIAVVNDNG